MTDIHADSNKHVRAYLAIFAALLVLTTLTVVVARLDLGGSAGIVIALAIASVKATLVALIFMHLRWERSASIWWALVLCAIFAIFLLLVPVLTSLDLPPQVQKGSWG